MGLTVAMAAWEFPPFIGHPSTGASTRWARKQIPHWLWVAQGVVASNWIEGTHCYGRLGARVTTLLLETGLRTQVGTHVQVLA